MVREDSDERSDRNVKRMKLKAHDTPQSKLSDERNPRDLTVLSPPLLRRLWQLQLVAGWGRVEEKS
jgi:hypothetical protein